MRVTFLLFCLASTAAHAITPPSVAIVGVTVVHPATGVSEPAMTVVITGDRIVALGKQLAPPRGARVVDGRGRWVIPGLIDSHVHFFQSGNLFTRPDVADFTSIRPYAQEVARNKANLAKTFRTWLSCGVTGVADFGGPFWNFELRDVAAATPMAPRVAVAGPLLSMVARPQLDLGDPPIIQVRTPEEARTLARKELARRPDFLKVWFIRQPGDNLAEKEAIVRAAGDEAHAAGVRLAVHAHELDTAKAALRAGTDVLVHSVRDRLVDEEFLTLARSQKAIYISTVFVPRGYELALSGKWAPTDEERQRADPAVLEEVLLSHVPEAAWPANVRGLVSGTVHRDEAGWAAVRSANLRAVLAAGIPLAVGTDAGNIGTVHGPSIFRELAMLAEAGLSPADVLRSATVVGAQVLGKEKDLGDVAPGKFADLLVLNADPLADVANLARTALVIRAGRVYSPTDLAPQRQ